jgi:peptide/nickel transport system ATP-binding protein
MEPAGGSLVFEARDLRRAFAGAGGEALALDGVSLVLRRGESVGLVGESGGGKSTLARALTRLVEPDSGELWLRRAGDRSPIPFHALAGAELRSARRAIQLVFQDPVTSLDPNFRAADSVEEALAARGVAPSPDRARAAREWLSRVGLGADLAGRFPRMLSGGERQRVAIARALAAEPAVLVLDEATSALDASTRDAVVSLVARLQKELGFAALWISHDLDVVAAACDRILVLYLGRIVEELPREALAAGDALHPYTQLLLSSEGRRAQTPPGNTAPRAHPAPPADARAIPAGCRFHPACPVAEMPRCSIEDPLLEEVPGDPRRRVACPIILRNLR